MIEALFFTIFFLNNYLHNLAVALLFLCAFIAYGMAQYAERGKTDTEKRFRSLYPRLKKIIAGLVVFSIAGGLIRVFSPEWTTAAASGRLAPLKIKYGILLLLFSLGLFFWIVTEKKVRGEDWRTFIHLIGKGLFRFLSSKSLSIGLLIAGAGYFFYLTVMWFINIRPPADYMIWFPVLVIILLFLTNVLISLFTRSYGYGANIIFHAAFVIMALGVGLSLLYRFEGRVVLTEGDVFWGEKQDYTSYRASQGIPILRTFKKAFVEKNDDGFERTAPKVSFKLDKIIPKYWGGRLHFTRLDGEIKYPAETMENKGIVRLNGGLTIHGARVRHSSFGFAPEFLFEDLSSGFIRKQAAIMAVFPPGAEDHIEIGSYMIYIQLLSDPGDENGRLTNKSMNLVDPIFLVHVTWLGRQIYKGALRQGESIVLGNKKISFSGVKYWLQFEIVYEPGEIIILAGFVTLVAGILLRLLPVWGVYKKGA